MSPARKKGKMGWCSFWEADDKLAQLVCGCDCQVYIYTMQRIRSDRPLYMGGVCMYVCVCMKGYIAASLEKFKKKNIQIHFGSHCLGKTPHFSHNSLVQSVASMPKENQYGTNEILGEKQVLPRRRKVFSHLLPKSNHTNHVTWWI